MELSYDGHPLLFDANEQVQEFCAQYQRWLQADQAPPSNSLPGRDVYLNNFDQLPRLNYPAVPSLRINQLYWPTGATRWGRMYGLADSTTVTDELQDLANAGEPKTLKVSFDTEQEFQMYLLPPVRISSMEEDALWLLPFVDARWKWQYLNVGNIAIGDLASWSSLFSLLATQLDVTLDITVDSDYLLPHQRHLLRPYENAAIVLDVATTSVGSRVTFLKDGTVTLQDPTTGANSLASNTTDSETPWSRIAGGDVTPNMIPESVIVTFPRGPCGNLHSETKSVTSEAGTLAGAEKVIHSSAFAMFTTAGGGTPTNDSELDALADVIAIDWAAWEDKRFDHTYVGLKEWTPTGFEDHILYDFGGTQKANTKVVVSGDDDEEPTASLETGFQPLMTTRIVPLPYNFGIRFQLSGNDELMDYIGRGDGLIATTTESIAAADATEPGSGLVDVRRLDDSDEYETIIDDLTVYNDAPEAVASGAKVQLKQDPWCKWWIDVDYCE